MTADVGGGTGLKGAQAVKESACSKSVQLGLGCSPKAERCGSTLLRNASARLTAFVGDLLLCFLKPTWPREARKLACGRVAWL